MSLQPLAASSATSTFRLFAACFPALLIAALLAMSWPVAAQDDARTKQLRLLCAMLSGDLTDPGGIAAFRRCLTTQNPVDEIRRDTIGGAGTPPMMDRPAAVAPSGYGRNSREMLAEGVQRFQTVDGKIAYAVDKDGKLWRWTIGAKDARVLDQSVATPFATKDGRLFVLDDKGALWRDDGDTPNRFLIDRTVADFQSVDSEVIYVRGTDRKLWRENGDASNRTLVDRQVAAFQAIDASVVYVLGTDGKLWRETGDMNTRVLVAVAVAAFQYIPDGEATYVLNTDAVLWRQVGTRKPEEVDRDVAAFQAVDMHLTYVLGKDGRLWQDLGNRDQAVLVDGNVLVGLGQYAFQALDAQHVLLVGSDHKLWAETMPPGR
jgi:hypothetical protein